MTSAPLTLPWLYSIACSAWMHPWMHPKGYIPAIFPDSTRHGDAEAGDNNQIQVALVLAREK